jgi:hypothetical protein
MPIFAFGSQSTSGASTVVQDGSVLVWNAAKGAFIPVPPSQQNPTPPVQTSETINSAQLYYLSMLA